MKQRVFHRRTDKRAASAGFTIVELAVVIAMTLILTALLLPALSSAKEKSRRAVCKSNLKQLYLVCQYYADDYANVLPSAADNEGYYHSVRLSDQTFTNLVANYAGGSSNIFYCPNLMFGAGSSQITNHDQYGYIIGYSYLANNVLPATKGADTGSLNPQRLSTAPQTNILFADANYWAPNQTAFGPGQSWAPHTAMGGKMAAGSAASAAGASTVAATNSAGLGAVGGNILYYSDAVTWRTIGAMQTYSASSGNDAYGNW